MLIYSSTIEQLQNLRHPLGDPRLTPKEQLKKISSDQAFQLTDCQVEEVQLEFSGKKIEKKNLGIPWAHPPKNCK